jgi:RHS repeat-associated protein
VLGNYSNNHLGLRVEKEAKDPLQPNAPPAIFRTLWNGRHAFQDRDTSGNTLSRYENDGRHTVSFWSSTDGSQALHHDALGSITATTDNSGQLKSETVYDAFGNIASRSGQSANKFGYTGHQMDQETGLIYFQARYYDPQTGRFITQDPYEGDWNTPLSLHHYLYAYGNPTTYIDLHGYESISANIDKAAEGCGAWSCAGYALAKGAIAGLTFGFTVVHDPVRDQYDEGKITGAQYVKRGIGGGAAMVAVNAAGVAVGGAGGTAATVSGTMVRGALTGGLTSGGTDAATQGVNISAGLQDKYDLAQTAKTTAISAGLGIVAPLIPAALKTEAGQAVAGAISSTVRKTREAVETAAQSVSSRVKGVVTQEAGTMGSAGAKITSKSVAAEPDARTISIMGFRGQGTSDALLENPNMRPELVTGHVGVSFDGGNSIPSFGPHMPGRSSTYAAVKEIQAASRTEGHPGFPGVLQDDIDLFKAAAARTGEARGGSADVFKLDIGVTAKQFEHLQSLYGNMQKAGPMENVRYLFSGKNTNNCASFPGACGIEPKLSKKIQEAIQLLEREGQKWVPK